MKLKDLKCNQVPFWYQLYEGEEDVVDEDGYMTGETAASYGNPVKAYARVTPNGVKTASTPSGETAWAPFGLDIEYDRMISTVQNLPIDEYSRLFIEVEPEINEDGGTDTEPDYSCVLKANGLNQNVWAIKRIKKS